ncbi:MAG: carboxypeptidase-like regulatory domain-containing protein [Flammeovirgaceae bacterium]|nr:carboxypeptidase-like regulatory domain-containing protein [Flammeovirgaceae bacterium]
MKWIFLFVCLSLINLSVSHGQTNILSGVVLDSASLQPLSYVAVQVKGKNIGQSTNETGRFSIECSLGDTLVFTRLGHKALLFIPRNIDRNLNIILAEDSRMLNDVTVYGDVKIAGVDDQEYKANTQVKLKNQPLAPEANEVATFGPGITIGFGGKDKTKVKRDENSKTEVYRKTITSDDTKKQLIDLYQISEEIYYKKLERFNNETPDAKYLTDPKEIVTLMIQFFAMR